MNSLQVIVAILALFCVIMSFIFLPFPWVAIGLATAVIIFGIFFLKRYAARKRTIENKH